MPSQHIATRLAWKALAYSTCCPWNIIIRCQSTSTSQNGQNLQPHERNCRHAHPHQYSNGSLILGRLISQIISRRCIFSLGTLFGILIDGGATSLRVNNPSIATLVSSFTFPTGFVIITILKRKLSTANLFVVVLTTCLRKASLRELARNLVSSYIMNMADALFVAGFLCW